MIKNCDQCQLMLKSSFFFRFRSNWLNSIFALSLSRIIFGCFSNVCYKCIKKININNSGGGGGEGRGTQEKCGSIEVSEQLSTYPSPKTTLTLTSHLGQNCDLWEG